MPVLSGQRWAPTGATTTVTWSFATANYPSLQTQYGGYASFTSAISSTYQSLIRAAFDAWEAVANIDFVQVTDGAGVNIRVGNADIDGRAGPGQSSILGQASSWYSGSYYRTSQVLFDVDAYDGDWFYSVAVHEIGHAIGLDHSPVYGSLMYAQVNPQNASGQLTADDIQGVVSIYGSKSAAADDYAASSATTGAIPAGGSLAGTLERAGDVDWFRVSLSAGRSYQFDLEGADTGRGTLANPWLEVRAAGGGLLQLDDDSGVGSNARLSFTPTASGTYFLAAGASGNAGAGTYLLTVAEAPAGGAVLSAGAHILRQVPAYVSQLADGVATGALSYADAVTRIVSHADATTSVATLSYQFFTGRVPTMVGLDYLVSPTGPNPNNLNSAYYQGFNLENRYINFAVNLGKLGEGRAPFAGEYGGLSLFDATAKAYAEIFGGTPSAAKVAALLSGGRDDYFEYYGGDGENGIGTKAAMVGWLLAEAEKANVGQYARSNAAFLTDLADGAIFNVDLLGVYGRPEYDYVA